MDKIIRLNIMAEWIKKQYPTIYCFKETHFSLKNIYRKGQKTCQANVNKQR